MVTWGTRFESQTTGPKPPINHWLTKQRTTFRGSQCQNHQPLPPSPSSPRLKILSDPQVDGSSNEVHQHIGPTMYRGWQGSKILDMQGEKVLILRWRIQKGDY